MKRMKKLKKIIAGLCVLTCLLATSLNVMAGSYSDLVNDSLEALSENNAGCKGAPQQVATVHTVW